MLNPDLAAEFLSVEAELQRRYERVSRRPESASRTQEILALHVAATVLSAIREEE